MNANIFFSDFPYVLQLILFLLQSYESFLRNTGILMCACVCAEIRAMICVESSKSREEQGSIIMYNFSVFFIQILWCDFFY